MTLSNNARPLLPYKWEMILLLWLAFFLNQADRQIYNSVLPLIKADLRLSDAELGLVVSIFTWTYAALVPLAGYAGDVFRRKWVIFGSLLFWSTATVFTGVSTCLLHLVFFRGVTTGGGEAFYYPAANSLIGQIHHRTRAMAMAIHQTANYTGIVASGFIAAYIGAEYGWRAAFYVFGAAGVVLAMVLLFRLHDTPQPVAAADACEAPKRVPLSVVARAIFHKPTVWLLCLAFGGHLVANIGYLTWMPTFLHDKFALSLPNAGFSSMFYHHVFAMLGVLLGGRFSDRLAPRRRTVRMEVGLAGLLLGTPMVYLIGAAHSYEACLAATAAFGLFRGVYDSNLFVALFDVIEPRFRSSSVGIMLAFAFLVGAFSPAAVGWLKEHHSFDLAISSLALGYAFGAACLFVALRWTLARDYYHETPQETAP